MATLILAALTLVGLVLAPPGFAPAAALRRLIGVGAVCGNGVVEAEEDCDDGNGSSTDRCLPTCRLAACGDGQVRAHVEECDDGNQDDGDGCSRSCLSCPSTPDSFPSPTTGHCYWRKPDRLPWSEAAASCAAEGGHLASFSDDDEWREVTERLLAGGNAPAVWIGLREEDRNGVRDFGWVTGERILSAHWAIQEPRRGPDLDCGIQSEAGAWAASSCAETRAFVCERPGWAVSPRDGHAYRRFTQRLQWQDAQKACAARSGHLVTFSDSAEQSFVSGRFLGAYWIGGLYDERARRFRWSTGEPLEYSDYAPGQPDFLPDQWCLALDLDRRWYNRECDDRYRFVCEVE